VPDEPREPIDYRDAGVDIDAGAEAVKRIREAVRSTHRLEVIGDIGGFGGLFSAARIAELEDPVLVSATDGVGTKLQIARMAGQHGTVGVDLVAMCANDVLVSGAEPLFFLDYIAIGKLDPDTVEEIVSGVAEGCRQAGCALIGGEMAEHPGVMPEDDYDLAGFCVGVAERSKIVDGSAIKPGDVVLGLASTGLHSNGYSLVRKVLVEGHEDELSLSRVDLGGASLVEGLLEPTRIYVRSVLELLRDGVPITGLAHVTGGGITGNLARVLPGGCDAHVVLGSWRIPRVVELAVDAAGLSEEEALRTLNMGLGFLVVVDAAAAPDAAATLRESGERVYEVGEIVEGAGTVVYGG
jgi:phosphoribosylformylglycinamidine cyclo-ligase